MVYLPVGVRRQYPFGEANRPQQLKCLFERYVFASTLQRLVANLLQRSNKSIGYSLICGLVFKFISQSCKSHVSADVCTNLTQSISQAMVLLFV
jgi:hypothetical protein